MTGSYDVAITALESRVERLRGLLRYARRAFVIEFAGTPKSGKSTSVEAVRHLFTRNGFRVHVLSERAALCPIPMKGHLFFNTWCATSMLAELLENIEADSDIIIVDRGIFDALVWLTLQSNRGEILEYEKKAIEQFLLLERWRSLIDLSIMMVVDADKALSREKAQRISLKTGSIMNKDVLASMTSSAETAAQKYGNKFDLIKLDTTQQDVQGFNIVLANQILDRLANFLNPKILVVPLSSLKNIKLSAAGGCFDREELQKLLETIKKDGKFFDRDEAEQNSDVVQIIACGVLTRDHEIFVFQRKDKDPKSNLYGATTMWQGTHVHESANKWGLELIQAELMDRITESLYLSRVFSAAERGYCWDKDNPTSANHLGIIFKVEIDNPLTAVDLQKKEFRKWQGRGHPISGSFCSWDELKADQEKLRLENWSRAILAEKKNFFVAKDAA
jgi:predicted NUDIX family phosphoesterase